MNWCFLNDSLKTQFTNGLGKGVILDVVVAKGERDSKLLPVCLQRHFPAKRGGEWLHDAQTQADALGCPSRIGCVEPVNELVSIRKRFVGVVGEGDGQVLLILANEPDSWHISASYQ